MIVTGIFAMMTLASLVITIIAVIGGNEDMAILGFILTVGFFFASIVAGVFESDEFTTECETYCTEQGRSYDSVKTEGEDKYCICDTSLERHLIKKNTGVTIE